MHPYYSSYCDKESGLAHKTVSQPIRRVSVPSLLVTQRVERLFSRSATSRERSRPSIAPKPQEFDPETGIVTVKVLPRSGSLSSMICPPWAWTISLTNASPSPVPP